MPAAWELSLFESLNQLAGQSPILDTIIRLFVSDYFVPVVLSLTLLGLWFGAPALADRERQQRAVIAAVIAMGIANLLVLTVNMAEVVMRPRPFEVIDNAARTADMLFYHPPDPTFPSNSMAVTFAIAVAVFTGHRSMGSVALVLATAMGLSRVLAGVHFPLDVFAGAILGALAALVGLALLRLFEPVAVIFLQWARRLYLA